MVQELLLTALIVIMLVLFNFFYLRPRRILKEYQIKLQSLPYRSKIFPYRPTYNKYFDPIFDGLKRGDPYIDYKTTHQEWDVVVSNVYYMPFVEFIHPDFIREFYGVDRHYGYPKPKALVGPFKRITGPALAFVEGVEWKHKKHALRNIFNFQFLKSQTTKIAKVIDQCLSSVQSVHKKTDPNTSETYINIHMFDDIFINVTSQSILTVILGIHGYHEIDGIQVAKYLSGVVSDMMRYQLESWTVALGERFYDLGVREIDRSINQRNKKLKAWGMDVIRGRIAEIEKELVENDGKIIIDDTVKSMYMDWKDQDDKQEGKLSLAQLEEEIYCQFVGFFIGGTDTTANYLNMTLSYVGRYPEVERKLREEIDQYMKDDDYSFENLRNFKYIEAMQKQTTRIYGPANVIFFREALQDNYLNGLLIKKGTIISLNPIPNGYSPKYFQFPLEYRPERWLNGQCDQLPSFAITGFSGGARSCIGKQLALLESKIAIIKFMKRYKGIEIGKKDFGIRHKYLVCPEDFMTRLVIDQ